MKLLCPNRVCHEVVDWRANQCPRCGTSLTFGGLSKLYLGRLRKHARSAARIQCPTCRRPVPLSSRVCPHPDCGVAITFGLAVEVTVVPPLLRFQRFADTSPPSIRRRVQRCHLLGSSALFLFMLGYVDVHRTPDLVSEMFLTCFFLVGFLVVLVMVLPRFFSYWRAAAPLTRLGFFVNLLTLPLLMQILIHRFPTRAVLLFLVILVVYVAVEFVIGVQNLIDASENARRAFDVMDNQGRRAWTERGPGGCQWN